MFEDKYKLIEDSGFPEEIKAKMRLMIRKGDDAHLDALTYIKTEYGLNDKQADAIVGTAAEIMHYYTMDLIMELSAADMSDEDRRRIVSAVCDYMKLVTRSYWQSRTEAGLNKDGI